MGNMQECILGGRMSLEEKQEHVCKLRGVRQWIGHDFSSKYLQTSFSVSDTVTG